MIAFLNRPTSWEVKETLDREERDAVVIQKFVQSLVDKMMSIIEAAAVYEEPCEALPDTCAIDEEIYNIEDEELYEDLAESMLSPRKDDLPESMFPPPSLMKEEKANVPSTDTKVYTYHRMR